MKVLLEGDLRGLEVNSVFSRAVSAKAYYGVHEAADIAYGGRKTLRLEGLLYFISL